MDKVSVTFNVYFEDPFWVGVFERNISNKLTVSKVVFGSEPKEGEVYEYILKRYNNLKYSPPVFEKNKVKSKVNPKRVLRELKKKVDKVQIGTKSQIALKLLQEENKLEKKTLKKEKSELEKQRKYSLSKEKKLQKHKGR